MDIVRRDMQESFRKSHGSGSGLTVGGSLRDDKQKSGATAKAANRDAIERRVSVAVVSLAIAVGLAGMFHPRRAHAQSPKAPDATTVHAGQEIFQRNCMMCHSVNQGQVMLGPSLFAEMTKPQGKKSSVEVRTIIGNGKGKMPPFKDKLTAGDIDRLVAYLRTL